MRDDLRAALIASAQRVGADPLDLATVMSFESGFSPSIRGGSGNRHIGLIQFGIPEQKAYGAHQGQSFVEQLPAVERFLKGRGFRPGMGMLDLYSTINAGSPGRYNASDARNGGTPGSVADKVRDQMGEHRRKAMAFLGGSYTPPAAARAMVMPAEAGGQAASGRFGFAGPQASQEEAPTMAMPRAPEPDAGTTAAQLMSMLAGPGATSAAFGQPAGATAAAPMPRMPMAPAPPPIPFDAAQFYALLAKRGA